MWLRWDENKGDERSEMAKSKGVLEMFLLYLFFFPVPFHHLFENGLYLEGFDRGDIERGILEAGPGDCPNCMIERKGEV